MPRRTKFNTITGCDEYRVAKTGEVFAQHRLFLDDARHCADGVKHLTTAGDPELARKIAATPPGMAYWTATGPEGATCAQCAFFTAGGRLVGSCEKNEAFRKTQGERPLPHQSRLAPIHFRAATAACRHFRAK